MNPVRSLNKANFEPLTGKRWVEVAKRRDRLIESICRAVIFKGRQGVARWFTVGLSIFFLGELERSAAWFERTSVAWMRQRSLQGCIYGDRSKQAADLSSSTKKKMRGLAAKSPSDYPQSLGDP